MVEYAFTPQKRSTPQTATHNNTFPARLDDTIRDRLKTTSVYL